jgi:hypothetical protein
MYLAREMITIQYQSVFIKNKKLLIKFKKNL